MPPNGTGLLADITFLPVEEAVPTGKLLILSRLEAFAAARGQADNLRFHCAERVLLRDLDPARQPFPKGLSARPRRVTVSLACQASSD